MDLDLADGLKWYIVFLFSTLWHEAAHAWVAHKLGDDTAYHGGQVSLDPTPHIKREPVGMVVVPLLSYFLGGWMVGWASAPYSPSWAVHYPRRAAVMALAGPAANLMIVCIAAVLMRVGFEWGVFRMAQHGGLMEVVTAAGALRSGWSFCAKMLSLFFSLNLLLGTFNLLPVPPLDGSNIPFLFLRGSLAESYRAALRQPAFGMIGLLLAWKVFGSIFHPIFSAALKVLSVVVPAH
ncbi:MAG TPA: site-2 protease family protein [Verrucomicrobiae bacterium]|nr:site-2 protease family protein [Verrucomicrobiae bacterium]